MRWQPGDAIVRRDVWHGDVMVGWGGIVVHDTDELLVLYMPEGAPLGFTDRDFFGEPHPGAGATAGTDTASSSSTVPGQMHSVWVFWAGPERSVRRLVREHRGAVPADAARLRHAGSRARPRGRARRLVELQGRRAARPVGRARPLDARGGRRDSCGGRPPGCRARRRSPLVERRVGDLGARPDVGAAGAPEGWDAI